MQMKVNGLLNIGDPRKPQCDIAVLLLDNFDGYASMVPIHFP